MRQHFVVGWVVGWVVASMACGDRAPSSPPDAAAGTDAGVTSDAAPDAYVIPAPPVTENGTLRLEIADSVAGTLVATDPNGQPLTYSIVSQPTSGTISSFDPATGTFTYTSTSLVPGSDSFTFQANDGALDAPTPGVITITVDPAVFTGTYSVAGVTDNGAACSPFSIRVGQAPAYFDVNQHSVSCGNTTYNFTAYRSSSSASASLLSFSRSQFVSGCGTVTQQFRIERTLTGFTYQNTTHTPCFGIGTHVITGTATRTPIAYLFAEGTLAHGSKLQGSTSTQTLTLRNAGRPSATAIAFTGPMAPFGFTGGAFPGTGGTCAETLAGLSTCTISIDMSTAALGS
ncbi:MAG TPA: Ig-like domain-containing protein, partial [Kofleriaceae bacterium]